MRLITLLGWIGAALVGLPLLVLVLIQGYFRGQLALLWRRLVRTPGGGHFSEDMIEGLPPAAQRYLRHAIAPGTPLAGAVRMRIHAFYQAEDHGSGFWERRAVAPGRGGLWMTLSQTWPRWDSSDGFYIDGLGVERGAAWSLIPLRFTQYTVPDITRLFQIRTMHESLFVPASLLPERGAVWQALDDQSARVTVSLDGRSLPITLRIDPDGRLVEACFESWNFKGGEHWRDVPTSITVAEERSFGGYTIPSTYTMTLYKENQRDPGVAITYHIDEAAFS